MVDYLELKRLRAFICGRQECPYKASPCVELMIKTPGYLFSSGLTYLGYESKYVLVKRLFDERLVKIL